MGARYTADRNLNAAPGPAWRREEAAVRRAAQEHRRALVVLEAGAFAGLPPVPVKRLAQRLRDDLMRLEADLVLCSVRRARNRPAS